MWLALRVHPVFRRRAKTAAHTLAERTWRARTVEWTTVLRPQLREGNRALQQEDIGALDDAALVDHVRRARTNTLDGHVLHFDLHGDDLGPLGLYLVSCQDWGIAPGEAIAALAGHSPSTAAPVEALRKVGLALLDAGWTRDQPAPATLDDLRAVRSRACPRPWTTTCRSSAGGRSRGTTSTGEPSASSRRRSSPTCSPAPSPSTRPAAATSGDAAAASLRAGACRGPAGLRREPGGGTRRPGHA